MRATLAALDADEDMDDNRIQLFDLHEQRLFRLARRLSASHDEATDLLQETFVRALGSRSPLPADEREQDAWLVTAMVNVARDRSRRHAVRAHFARVETPADTNDPEAGYLARIAVQGALGRLDARRRAVVVLHELEGEPVARIATLLGVAPVTVRWHLARAKKELSLLLGHGEEL
jgi:RNA polymerase sigma-70 factor (ECF subfamily)